MVPPEGKGGRKDGKSGRATKKSGTKKAGDNKRGGAKGDDGLDFGPVLHKRGLFAASRADICPLRNLMYGHGDVRPESINSASVDLVEDIIVDYCATLLQKGTDQAALRGIKLQPEDILFLLRKDPRKFARGKELLTMNEEIKQARKQFEDDDAMLKK